MRCLIQFTACLTAPRREIKTIFSGRAGPASLKYSLRKFRDIRKYFLNVLWVKDLFPFRTLRTVAVLYPNARQAAFGLYFWFLFQIAAVHYNTLQSPRKHIIILYNKNVDL